MKNTETAFLSNPAACDCCGDIYSFGDLVVIDDGDSICEECHDIIETTEDHKE